MRIRELCKVAHEDAVRKGWYDEGFRPFAELLCLIHSEVSEALEAYRATGSVEPSVGVDSKPEGVPSELADVVIRIADMCDYLKIDLEKAVRDKLEYNRTRPHRHGGKVI